MKWTLSQLLAGDRDGDGYWTFKDTEDDGYALWLAETARKSVYDAHKMNIYTVKHIGRAIRALGDPRSMSAEYLDLLRSQKRAGKQLGLDFDGTHAYSHLPA